MKKFIYIFIIILIGLWTSTTRAQTLSPLPSTSLSTCPAGQILDLNRKCVANPNYILLAPLSDELEKGFNPTSPTALSNYLNTMIKIVIGVSAVLAVVMIVIGGIEYMTSELIHSKEAGKDRITGALIGLLIALGAYALLYTINPDLLKSEFNIKDVTVQVDVDEEIKGRLGQGNCQPITSGVCSASSLETAFPGRASQASSICNGESRGVANAASGVDKGSDGNPFSFGLFQVNIIAHADAIGDGQICKGIFQVDPNPPGKVGTSSNDSTLGGCLERKSGVCIKYAARVVDRAKYQNCVNFITKPEENIKFAANLQSRRNWNQWGFNSSCGF
ncbi:pilin [Candidatus Nomurabacteria bacterium]|nr:pilin [Candidatus Nomurabacteria bacterium]